MKKYILLFLLLPSLSYSQISKNEILVYSLCFVSGVSSGFEEVVKFKYTAFDSKFSIKNDQWWDPSISAKNKYNSSIPFSTSLMVWTTDSYHMFRFGARLPLFISIGISLNEKNNFWKITKKTLICYGLNRAGQYLIYDLIF